MELCEFKSTCPIYEELKASMIITMESIEKEFCNGNYSLCPVYQIYTSNGLNKASEYPYLEDILKTNRIVDDQYSSKFADYNRPCAVNER